MLEGKNVTVRLPIELYNKIKAMSDSMGVSVTSLLIISIWNNVAMQDKQ